MSTLFKDSAGRFSGSLYKPLSPEDENKCKACDNFRRYVDVPWEGRCLKFGGDVKMEDSCINPKVAKAAMAAEALAKVEPVVQDPAPASLTTLLPRPEQTGEEVTKDTNERTGEKLNHPEDLPSHAMVPVTHVVPLPDPLQVAPPSPPKMLTLELPYYPRINFFRKLVDVSGSLRITIPKAIVQTLDCRPNETVKIYVLDRRRIVIEREA